MKKNLIALVSVIAMISGMAVFLNQRQNVEAETTTSEKLRVVSTNSIIDDMVQNVGGKHVANYSIVQRGTDPHEYEPRPTDIAATAEADVVFYNGLNLETGGNGWFKKLVQSSKKEFNRDVFAVSKGVKVKYLTTNVNEPDPHAWLDLANGIKYVENINRTLQSKDPQHAAAYQKNTDRYVAQLTKLHTQAQTKFSQIPAEQRLLVTSEGAFKYFSAAYDIPAAYIWELNTEAQGTPAQMRAVLKKVNCSKVKSLFVESSVSPKSMNKVAQETSLPVASTVFTDSLANEGEPGDTYYTMMKWNLDKIYDGLK
ncbi:metal ABC transporter solute-binding protein, Zn/Mn family [Lactiplantibacillus xiangfangensis]|uniref:Manganese abc transporter, substrate binding protein (Mtsa) n=1 Tax=Lactiplantibacillus xiangfangensis TaxID=942150 RepID=A0A0R2MH57_9LACO|nr:zinc ABC transporter substrate-binding protein [Lactiplantibacillus xiangfangensis]KRO11504.1 manganese abc transporter, substrate binding protein (mtsa) [Lactiplantibacillus xiangfangensis]